MQQVDVAMVYAYLQNYSVTSTFQTPDSKTVCRTVLKTSLNSFLSGNSGRDLRKTFKACVSLIQYI